MTPRPHQHHGDDDDTDDDGEQTQSNSNSTGPINNNSINTIETTVQFDIDDQTRHSVYLGPTPYDGFNHRVGAKTLKKITIGDGRNNDDLSLDRAAFELTECPTALATEDFYKIQEDGNEELKSEYYNEVSECVRKKLGCDTVVCIHSQVRNESKSNGRVIGGGVSRYATVPHTDSSPVSSDVEAL